MKIENKLYKVKYLIYKILKKDIMALQIEHYKRNGAKVGNNVRAFSPISSSEPYLLSIGNDVTISEGVVFLTHDNSVIKDRNRVGTDLVGKITIGDNCFIGCNTIILPGVFLGDGVIVGAGSVVTKSFYGKSVIIAGNPAKIISYTDEFFKKSYSQVFNFAPEKNRMTFDERKSEILLHSEKLIVKQNAFEQ